MFRHFGETYCLRLQGKLFQADGEVMQNWIGFYSTNMPLNPFSTAMFQSQSLKTAQETCTRQKDSMFL
jgi:hypothetical protein